MINKSVEKSKSTPPAARVRNAARRVRGDAAAERLDEATRATGRIKPLRIDVSEAFQQKVEAAFAKHPLPADGQRAETAARNLLALQMLLDLSQDDVDLLLEQPNLLQVLGDPDPGASLLLDADRRLRTQPPLGIARALAQASFKELAAKLMSACSGRHVYALCVHMLGGAAGTPWNADFALDLPASAVADLIVRALEHAARHPTDRDGNDRAARLMALCKADPDLWGRFGFLFGDHTQAISMISLEGAESITLLIPVHDDLWVPKLLAYVGDCVRVNKDAQLTLAQILHAMLKELGSREMVLGAHDRTDALNFVQTMLAHPDATKDGQMMRRLVECAGLLGANEVAQIQLLWDLIVRTAAADGTASMDALQDLILFTVEWTKTRKMDIGSFALPRAFVSAMKNACPQGAARDTAQVVRLVYAASQLGFSIVDQVTLLSLGGGDTVSEASTPRMRLLGGLIVIAAEDGNESVTLTLVKDWNAAEPQRRAPDKQRDAIALCKALYERSPDMLKLTLAMIDKKERGLLAPFVEAGRLSVIGNKGVPVDPQILRVLTCFPHADLAMLCRIAADDAVLADVSQLMKGDLREAVVDQLEQDARAVIVFFARQAIDHEAWHGLPDAEVFKQLSIEDFINNILSHPDFGELESTTDTLLALVLADASTPGFDLRQAVKSVLARTAKWDGVLAVYRGNLLARLAAGNERAFLAALVACDADVPVPTSVAQETGAGAWTNPIAMLNEVRALRKAGGLSGNGRRLLRDLVNGLRAHDRANVHFKKACREEAAKL